MKNFPGQAKNEKILFFQKEDLIYFIIKNFISLSVIGGISLFFFFLTYILSTNILLSILIAIIIFLVGLIYISLIYNKTYVIITNKRILKFVRNGLFSEHLKELKLDQLNEVSATKQGFLEKLLKVGNIKIVGKDKENVIWFKGIKYPQEVVLYISRLRDYVLIENPNYKLEKLNPFIPRKYRKSKNK